MQTVPDNAAIGSWYPAPQELLARPLWNGLAIDPPNPHEIDDAITVERISKKAFHVAIHVADGGLLLGTPYVDTARNEGWSRYHSTYGTAPMLPDVITKQTLGLDAPSPHGAPAVTIEFVHDKRTGIGDIAVGKSRVDVTGITYRQFAKRHAKFENSARRIEHVAHFIHPAGYQDSFSSERLGEETVMQYMVAANFIIAREMEKQGLPWLFRNHTDGAYSRWGNEEERQKLQQLRTALYGSVALRHEGLGIEQYCHFTSPLRRFADLANHLTLHAYMSGLALPFSEADIDQIASELTAKYIERSINFRNM